MYPIRKLPSLARFLVRLALLLGLMALTVSCEEQPQMQTGRSGQILASETPSDQSKPGAPPIAVPGPAYGNANSPRTTPYFFPPVGMNMH